MAVVLLRSMLRIMVSPRAVIDELCDSERASGVAPVVVAGVAWALLCGTLYIAGHQPSVVLWPALRQHYYLLQALFVTPLLLAMWQLGAKVAALLSGTAPDSRPALRAVFGYVLGAPLLWLLLLPDAVAYALVGHAGMGKLLRYYAPLVPLWTLVLGTLAIARASGKSRVRSALVMLLVYLLLGVIAGAALR